LNLNLDDSRKATSRGGLLDPGVPLDSADCLGEVCVEEVYPTPNVCQMAKLHISGSVIAHKHHFRDLKSLAMGDGCSDAPQRSGAANASERPGQDLSHSGKHRRLLRKKR
jgi:hypothetical protein